MIRKRPRRITAFFLTIAGLVSLTLPALADGLDISEPPELSAPAEPAGPSAPPESVNPSEPSGEAEPVQTAEPAEPAQPWTPSGASEWAVQNLQEADLLGLLPEQIKSADLLGEITRREMCYLATTAYEKITGNELIPMSTDYFTDTDDRLICAAYEIGITNGYPDGTFLPEKLLTRQEFAQILANFNRGLEKPVNLKSDFLKDFPDRGDVDDWAEDAFQEMVALGIINGTNGSLLPKNNTSRQEAIVMFLRNYKEANRYLKTEWLTAEQLAEMNKTAMEEAMSSEAGGIVSEALDYVKKGTPYIFGATGPNAFDCSGFTYYLFRKHGVNLSRTAQQQSGNGKEVSIRDGAGNLSFEHLQPGDLLFFASTYSSSDYITHVGIYMGNGQMVHAANSTRGVTVDSLSSGYYAKRFVSARRVL